MSLDRIVQPSENTGLTAIWDSLIRAISRALRGVWGSYDYSPTLVGGDDAVMVIERRGVLCWFSLTFTSTSSSGTATLPVAVDGKTAFASINADAYSDDATQLIIFQNASGSVSITGTYRVKE